MSAPDTIAEREAEIVEEFALFDEWLDKYEHIIEQGDCRKCWMKLHRN